MLCYTTYLNCYVIQHMLYDICYITCVLLCYKTCVTVCYITYVTLRHGMLYNIWYVI